MPNAFELLKNNIEENSKLREPQIEAYRALKEFYQGDFKTNHEREVGIVLPVGCGKSGCITITPFAFKSKRALVIAPGLSIAKQLLKDFNPSTSFYKKCSLLEGNEFPEPVEIRGKLTNRGDLDASDVVITNIQQLQGLDNRWMESLPIDFFDVIIFDEGHHSVAETWVTLKNKFPEAAIVNYSATPERADGQIMTGKVIYTFSVQSAIKKGYVKELTATRLNPTTLKYVRKKDGQEVEVLLDEVIKLGETDADFRRSIVTSKESLDIIVNASIHELEQLRETTSNKKLKIIASALNYDHCIQIVQAYRERDYSADYVHSKENSQKNDKVLQKLDNHELDVIVQVRKLIEGFDHPFLSVAAVFSVFSSLSPFVQFVGRIMRVIEQDSPRSKINQGIVVYHAGSNIAKRWDDFKDFSVADKEYFDQLLPENDFVLDNPTDMERLQPALKYDEKIDIGEQTKVLLDKSALLADDPTAIDALLYLHSAGITGNINDLLQQVEKIPVTKVNKRQAQRQALNDKVKNTAGQIIAKLKINPKVKGMDRSFRNNNFAYVISLINREINKTLNKSPGERHDLNASELDLIDSRFPHIIAKIEHELS
ncbi:DEAD/DEAH box helicase [Methylococcaceae bacterium CS1]|nr:DEAD/DEAH box helicase [Methylococcaceae bacterium CS1]TXL06190.1 DEAD/DEAH box helicase [Methylococcaceae bacterium CS2]